MGSAKKQRREKEREERKAEEGDFPKLKATADGSVKQKKTKTTKNPEEINTISTHNCPACRPIARSKHYQHQIKEAVCLRGR